MPKTPPPDRVNFPRPKGKHAFLTEPYIHAHYLQFTPFQSRQWRAKLPKGIYWLQDCKMVQWNWTLLQSYLIHGLESDTHKALVEEYMSTLPQSA
jgi:hypothetical protein